MGIKCFLDLDEFFEMASHTSVYCLLCKGACRVQWSGWTVTPVMTRALQEDDPVTGEPVRGHKGTQMNTFKILNCHH